MREAESGSGAAEQREQTGRESDRSERRGERRGGAAEQSTAPMTPNPATFADREIGREVARAGGMDSQRLETVITRYEAATESLRGRRWCSRGD